MTDHVRVGSKTKKARGGESVFAVPSPQKKAPRMTAVPPSAVSASPAVETPAATNAASFPSAPGNAANEFTASTTDSTDLDGCKFVSEVVGAPHAQQISTIIVQVNPNAFPMEALDTATPATDGTAKQVKKQEIQADRYWRCPPYCPVYTTTTVRPSDGTPFVMSHVADGMNPVADGTTWFRFVGVTLEDGAEDTVALKRHARTGKCKFTVATKGCVTIACSPDNARKSQFVYGDPFCISLYQISIPGGSRISGDAGKRPQKNEPTIRSTAFEGRLQADGQRTFVYSKKGIRIGTFVKLLDGPHGGALVELL